MLRYNRARRAEWLEAQRKLENEAESGTLGAARLAYVKGQATEEQIRQVEEANLDAEAKGLKLPPLLAPPERRTHFEETFGNAAAAEAAKDGQRWEEGNGKGVVGVWSGIGKYFGVGKDNATSAGENAVAAVGGAVQKAEGTVAHTAGTVSEQAMGLWAKEKENQKNGGSLDKLGVKTAETGGKKGWFW